MHHFHSKSFLLFLLFIAASLSVTAQQGVISIKQDAKIPSLLKLKKEMIKNNEGTNSYKINIYTGNRSGAEATQDKFKKTFYDWATKMVYETPNYKIYVSNFRTRLEADRALMRIKKKYSSAFIFKPKKEKI